jgi:RimJ/RimL family protein N-acetyltransferase
MIAYAAAIDLVVATLAAEAGCSPADLTSGDVRLFVKPAGGRPPLARRYWTTDLTFTAVSLGRGAALTASAAILDAVGAAFRGANRDQAFEPGRLATVSALLAPQGRMIYGPYPRLVCGADTLRERRAPSGITVRVEDAPTSERVQSLEPSRWPNAISSRPSVPAAALALATREEQIVGVAATSVDNEHLWQIGIDVAEPYRGVGIGVALTSALAQHILEAGAAPFYGAAPANLPSINTALAAGFRLAWVEAFSAPAGRW